MTIKKLIESIQKCWASETSYWKNWNSTNPSRGHCSVSALIIQKHLGGEIAYSKNHYWNILRDGTVIDATQQQFFPKKPPYLKTRAKILENENINKRYEIFEKKVERELKK